jgi:hypothetical protein
MCIEERHDTTKVAAEQIVALKKISEFQQATEDLATEH